MIPEDWDLCTLGEVVEFLDGKRRPVKSGDRAKMRGVYPYYGASGVVDYVSGYLFDEELILLGEDGENILSRNLPLAFRVSGKIWVNNHAHVMRPSARVDIGYLTEFLESIDYSDFNSGTAQPKLNKQSCVRLPVVVPPVTEQRAIAAALADADALIAALEAMIAKKRDLKHVAMRHLLTGKTRLPGFSREWEMKRLEEIGEISGAGVDKKIVEGELPIRLLNYTDAYKRTFVKDSDLDQWVTAPPLKIIRCSIRKGDVFFTPSSETRDDIAHCVVAVEDISDAAYSYHVTRLRITDNWDTRFPAYAFQTREFLDQAQTVCDGSGTRYVISLSKFRGLTVRFPERSEQAAIAEVLSDMDADLSALNAQAAKARAVKQGMVQELLTGKVRLA